MGTEYWVLALAGGGVVFLALLSLSFPWAPRQQRAESTRSEAARSWQSPDGKTRRRVLLVGRGTKEQRADEARLRAAGYQVTSCPGPEGSLEAFPYGECLMLDEGKCPLSKGADAIVFGLQLDSGTARAVLRGYSSTGIPLCVRTSERESQWYAGLLHDTKVTHNGTDGIVSAVEGAMAAPSPATHQARGGAA